MTKKIVCVLMMVLMVTGLVFAVPVAPTNATLTLNGAVGEKLYHKFSANAALTTETFLASDEDPSRTVDMTSIASQNLGYYNLYTNYNGTITVVATASGFSSLTAATSKIGYSLNGTLVDKDSSGTTIPSFMTVEGEGTRVLNTSLSLILDATSLGAAASATDYTATVIIALSAS